MKALEMASNNLVLQDVTKIELYFTCGGLADLYKGQWTRHHHGEVLP
jgi:hypothetical protein